MAYQAAYASRDAEVEAARVAALGGYEVARDAARGRWFSANASLVTKGRCSYLEVPIPYGHKGMSVGEYIDAALRATPADACEHDWVDARNKYVKSGEVCSKCYALRPGNQSTPADGDGHG